ncbi:MAG: YfiR family protein [Gammaproteobacteria bacterium]|nr:YfiR family protein [Gammaproteobacteria bacterium]
MIAFISLPCVQAGDKAQKEQAVKAGFIYNLIRMVEWPKSKSANSHASMILCFLGNGVFNEAFSTIKNRKSRKQPVTLKKDLRPHEIQQCHLVLINRSERKCLKRILRALGNRPILTVGDSREFAKYGVMVNLEKGRDGRMGIVVNLQAARRTGLRIDSRLLNLATIVSGLIRSKKDDCARTL